MIDFEDRDSLIATFKEMDLEDAGVFMARSEDLFQPPPEVYIVRRIGTRLESARLDNEQQ